VSATGTPPLSYQWSFNGAAISGATGASYTLLDAQAANAGNYTVSVSNGTSPAAQSAACTLTVNAASSFTPPVIVADPFIIPAVLDQTIILSLNGFTPPGVNAESGPPATNRSPDSVGAGAGTGSHENDTFTYQWFKNGVAIVGANGTTYEITDAAPAIGDQYTCLVSNAEGEAFTSPQTVNVESTPNPGRLTNLSCRANSEAGANELIAGFEIGGQGTSGSLPVLVRASGPALAAFGVPGVLPDPELTLDQSVNSVNVNVATNAGWGGTTQLVNAAASVGAFAWSSGSSKDSAVYQSLAEGAYTAQVTGVTNDSGVALAEVYDATPSGTYTPSSPRLTNISARVEVGTGGNILIAGFEISGTTSKTVLIRASGPVLKNFGLTGVLADPELSLYQSVAGVNTLLQTNTGWGGNPQIATAAANVGAFSWGTTATADSAILVTLPPGAYTAEEAGASGDTGIGLIEVYEVP
jgi:hypothetical protein